MKKCTSHKIAKWFLSKLDRDAGDSITHLKLQKLVYYAQAWALVLLDSSLFDEEIEAWAHGPVIPSLFQKYKDYEWKSLPSEETSQINDKHVLSILEDVWIVYGEHSGKALEELTHNENPWKNARGNIAPEAWCDNIIEKKDMKNFYKNMYDMNEE